MVRGDHETRSLWSRSKLFPARLIAKFLRDFVGCMAAKIGNSQGRRNRARQARRPPRTALAVLHADLRSAKKIKILQRIWRAVMAGMVEKKLQELGVVLAEPTTPSANYVPFVRTGNLLTVSGQICYEGGKLVATGKLGAGVSLEEGQKAARACAINVLAQVKAALGDLDKVVRVVRLGGFVNSAPNFVEGPKVMNGASDLMVAAFGDKGKHARSTIGVAVLPLDSAMEVEALFEVS
jgi:enamine deaminase RidA (YjgF/YER057c/UK114 family)